MNLQTEISPELWGAVRRSYESQSWSNAILDGIYYLSDAIRSKSGLQSDGTALAGQAFGGKAPKLLLSKLQTESEQSFQLGVEQLLRGLYQAIRNPRSHDRLDDSQNTTDSLLVFVNFLLGVIGHAKTEFSLDDCVARVLEENFVPNRRYAELIFHEIPPRQRLNVCLIVYRRRTETDGVKLKEFFRAGLATLEPTETEEFFAAISEELRENSEEDRLRATLQILDHGQWVKLSEFARLRTENRLIRNVKEGRYMRSKDKCTSGALATWSINFWGQFALKGELLSIIADKLASSSAESQGYALKYLCSSLHALADKPPFRLRKIVLERLKAGDSDFLGMVSNDVNWSDEIWGGEIQAARDGFVACQPTPEIADDDLPF